MPSLKSIVLAGASAFIASCACQPEFPVAEPSATAVGDPAGAATTAALGPAGGTLTSSDGKLTLTVPPDALPSPTTLSVTPLTRTAHGGVGPGWRLEPEGTTFAKPVTLSVKLPQSALAATPAQAFGFATQTADGFWQWETSATVDTSALTATASITHFSDWSLVYGFNLRPVSKTLKVNEAAQFVVAFCFTPEPAEEGLVQLAYECDISEPEPGETPLLPTARVTGWKVNGVEGGDATVGTVTGTDAAATYKAPAERPTPDTVSLSADIAWKDKGKLIVASSISIDPPVRVYKGTVQFTWSKNGQSASLGGPVTLTETASGSESFEASGSLNAQASLPNCSPYAGSTPVSGTMDLNVPADGRYNLALGGEAVSVTCNGTGVPFTFQYLQSPPCVGDGNEPPAFVNPDKLSGTSTCNDGAFTWDFSRTE